MKFGLGLFPTEPVGRLRELVHRAEAEGCFQIWLGDSQCLWRELFVTAGAVAVGTHRIRMGTGVTNLVTRHPSVVASAALTLHELMPGRVVLGLGAGDSAVRMPGLRPSRLAALESGIAELRRLLAGDDVAGSDAAVRYHLGYGVPAPVPVYVAASAPGLLRLAGRVADGIILGGGSTPQLIQASLEHVSHGASEAGRSRSDLEVVLWSPVSVSTDRAAARAAVRPYVARAVLGPLAARLDPRFDEVVLRLKHAYDYYRHLEAEAPYGDLVPDQLVDQFAIAGSPEECRRRLREITGSGIDQLAVVPFSASGRDRATVFGDFIALAGT